MNAGMLLSIYLDASVYLSCVRRGRASRHLATAGRQENAHSHIPCWDLRENDFGLHANKSIIYLHTVLHNNMAAAPHINTVAPCHSAILTPQQKSLEASYTQSPHSGSFTSISQPRKICCVLLPPKLTHELRIGLREIAPRCIHLERVSLVLWFPYR